MSECYFSSISLFGAEIVLADLLRGGAGGAAGTAAGRCGMLGAWRSSSRGSCRGDLSSAVDLRWQRSPVTMLYERGSGRMRLTDHILDQLCSYTISSSGSCRRSLHGSEVHSLAVDLRWQQFQHRVTPYHGSGDQGIYGLQWQDPRASWDTYKMHVYRSVVQNTTQMKKNNTKNTTLT